MNQRRMLLFWIVKNLQRGKFEDLELKISIKYKECLYRSEKTRDVKFDLLKWFWTKKTKGNLRFRYKILN